MPMQDSVTVHMNATPEQVWAVVTDVTRIGEFSPETFEAHWIEPATGPAVDAQFRAHVKRNEIGPTYWNNSRVLTCEPNVEFSFGVLTGKAVTNTWGYRLAEAEGGGTDVTEFFHLTENLGLKIYWTLWGWSRGKVNRNGMRRTLEAMKAVIEAE